MHDDGCCRRRAGHALIDRELYLPRSWADDRQRCRAAGIPDGLGFATKPRQAQAVIARAVAAGVPFAWFTADEGYGQAKWLQAWLEEYGIPAVLATGQATCRLRDGDRVSVDGTTGTVSIAPDGSGIHQQGLKGRVDEMSEVQPIDGLEGLTPRQQRHFRRSRRMLTRFPQTPRLFGGAHRAVFRLTGGGLGGTMQG